MKNKLALEEVRNDKEFFNEYQTMKQLKLNNIIRERVELYRDFVVNLVHYLHTSYLGKDYIKTNEDIKGHFNWGFNKVLADFETEGITFGDTDELRAYFFKYFHARIYTVETVPPIKAFIAFWDELFTLKSNKEKSQLTALIEIYRHFDTSFNKKSLLEKIL